MSDLSHFLKVFGPSECPDMREDVLEYCPVCESPIINDDGVCDFGCNKTRRNKERLSRIEAIEGIEDPYCWGG